MKNITMLLMAATILVLASCSDSSKSTTAPTSSSNPCGTFFNRRYPNVDTATLWHYVNGVRTTDFAKISSTGYLTVTCRSNPRKSGNYYICVWDTAGSGGQRYTIEIMRPTVDTLICSSNDFAIKSAVGRSYISMEIYGGTLPDSVFLSGFFIDSL